jgi:hypothetical protein
LEKSISKPLSIPTAGRFLSQALSTPIAGSGPHPAIALAPLVIGRIADPKPFVWSKSVNGILTRERRALNKLEIIKTGKQVLDTEH